MEHNGFVSWSVVIARSMYQMPLNFCPSIIHFLELMVTPRVQITVPICPINCCELLRRTFYFWGQLPIEQQQDSFLSGSNWKCSWRHVLIHSWWGLEMGDYFLALCFDGACLDVVLFFASLLIPQNRNEKNDSVSSCPWSGSESRSSQFALEAKKWQEEARQEGGRNRLYWNNIVTKLGDKICNFSKCFFTSSSTTAFVCLCPCVFQFMSDRPLTDFQPSLDIMLSNHCPPTRRMQETIIIIYLFPPVSSSTV